ncbi:MAG TPA: tRNA uridine-5-carboxymethylaminomethyl(34) synthesis GTPase MnmE [Polyangia bacterium]|nr:tRNA uridine-5-carboxymethylaminomethyl(34) synthesis GTPase MnmE [Polyangia bacterium]
MQEETIAAIATAPGGGIGVVRVSGPQALEVAARVVRPWPAAPESHRMWRAQAAGDEILCVVMRAPGSYTGEDVVELHGHGSALGLRALLAALVDSGARVAEPGEFTRRAFLSGRMDLSRAEAVAQVIGARTEQALRAAQANLRGATATAVSRARERVVSLLAEVEAQVDFPEEQLDFAPAAALAAQAHATAAALDRLCASWRRGRLLGAGLTVALVGRPNVGKSSLLNALVGQERALVTETPGTTRDYVEVAMDWDGVPVTLIDTAGEREATSAVERRGVELGRRRAAEADVAILVVDASAPALDDVRAHVVALNKIDLAPEQPALTTALPVVPTSALERTGLAALRAAVLAVAGLSGDDQAGEPILASERQQAALREAQAALVQAASALADGAPPELAAMDLRVALDRLGRVTGESVDQAVLDAVFARFCIGK